MPQKNIDRVREINNLHHEYEAALRTACDKFNRAEFLSLRISVLSEKQSALILELRASVKALSGLEKQLDKAVRRMGKRSQKVTGGAGR